MKRKDDRTEEQKQTHTIGIVARDKFMSGWGEARGRGGSPFGMDGDGVSKCGWACATPAVADAVEDWVRHRSEMVNVRRVDLKVWKPTRCATFHLYVAGEDHTAVLEARRRLQEIDNEQGDQAARDAAARNQLTLAQVVSRRICHEKRGWIDWSGKLSDKQKRAVVELLVWGSNRAALERAALDNFRQVRSAGILERVQIGEVSASYCAGQDYTSELRTVRAVILENY